MVYHIQNGDCILYSHFMIYSEMLKSTAAPAGGRLDKNDADEIVKTTLLYFRAYTPGRPINQR